MTDEMRARIAGGQATHLAMLKAQNANLTNSIDELRKQIQREEDIRSGNVLSVMNDDHSSTVNNSNLLSEGATSPKDVADNAELYSVD